MGEVIDRLKAALADRYAIEREVGSGGMATVYLAEDMRHHRKVAVKVLRPDLAATLGPERFLREIEIAARLQHPHILPLLDSGEADDFLYYVMPYVEGRSLRERLAREGALPVGDAVRIVRDVVDALTEAHAHGVVHRDIKPENVLLRGRHALVTDFGVAKAVSEATGRTQLTTAGVALGTPAYMAPEQASADPHVDHRVDIYAVGAVAYELLTGRPVFMGTTPQMVLSAHMAEVPQPVTKHRDTVPAALDAVVMRCLEKRPADRWQSAEDLLGQLEALATPSGGMTPTGTRPLPAASRGRSRLGWGVVAAVACIGAAALLVRALTPSPLKITTAGVTQVTSAPGREYQPAISPDGREVVYAASGLGWGARIVVQSAVEVGLGASQLGAEAGDFLFMPTWTHDGTSVRFCAVEGGVGCRWKQVGSRGGSVQNVSAPRPDAAYAWSPDGTRVVFAVNDSIFAYAERDGEPELLGVHTVEWAGLHSLAWSPDGRRIAYVNGNFAWTYRANVYPASIWVVDADGGVPVRVTDDTTLNVSPQWLPDNEHLLFVSNRDGARGVYAIAVGRDGPRGSPAAVLPSSDPHSISVSADGRRMAYAKAASVQNIWSMPIPRSGTVSIGDAVPVTTGSQVVESHDVSPDGTWITYDGTRRGNADIYRMPLEGGDPQVLVDLPFDVFTPKVSPDGREIVFDGGPAFGTTHIWVVPATGGTPTQVTSFATGFSLRPAWSPDGRTIAFESQGPRGTNTLEQQVWTVSRDTVGGRWDDPRQLTDFECLDPDWAPDGTAVVCDANPGIVLVSLDGSVRWRYEPPDMQVARPRFSPDGATIYFMGSEGDGSSGVWAIPPGGDQATKLVAFDVPGMYTTGFAPTVTSDRLYLTVSEFESDIWVVDLEW